MKALIVSFFAISAVSSAFAQVSLWGQCGGIGYSGSTTCVSGAVCNYQNDYYSQCIPGSAATTAKTTTTVKTATTTVKTTTTTKTTTPASTTTQNSNVPVGTVITKCNRPGVIALAYDDGPSAQLSSLVDTLDAAGAKGTFFLAGNLWNSNCIYNRASAIQKAYKSGHQIASHTWSHPDFATLSAADITDQMRRQEQAMINILGVRSTYMRPPYVSTGGNTLPTLKNLGYHVINDDVDTQDWNNLTPDQSMQRLQSAGASGNGHILLMHDTYVSTATQLTPKVIAWAKQNNLKMVTVADCLGDSNPYVSGTKNGQTTC